MTDRNCTVKKQSHQSSNLIYGVAYNSLGKHKATLGGVNTAAYAAWYNMLKRCYYHKLHTKQPTYKECSVASDWLDFQVFAEWYCGNKFYECGYQLDKDILIPNNKVYNSDACCLVPHEINSLFKAPKLKTNGYPQGVYFDKQLGRYRARLNIKDKAIHLGLFSCPKKAHKAYVEAKEAYVKEKAIEWKDRIEDRVFNALMAWTVY